MNISDSERIAFSLESLGYIYERDIYKADLAVITTCGVKQGAENRIYGLVPTIKKSKPNGRIILTGCLSGEKVVKNRLKGMVDIWMPIVDLENISKLLGEDVVVVGENERDYLKLKAKYESDFSAFVPIGNGCDNYCSYCYVPYARGREIYRDVQDILEEVKGLIKKGYKEITLIAQNVNSYKSGSINFSKLLGLVNDLDGDFWLRFSTSHPKDMSDELIDVMGNCDKLCHHVHLPAQAGSNKVLKKMNRKYTKEHYLGLVDKIRVSMNKKAGELRGGICNPPVSITTDIIVGFPGETEDQFKESVRLFEEVKYDMAYISPYSPRPNTAAAKMKESISEGDKERRVRELNDMLSKYCLENNKAYQNKIVEVLVDRKTNKGEWLGKTRTSKTVIIDTLDLAEDLRGSRVDSISGEPKDLIGNIVKVKIDKVKNFGLYGKIV